MTREEFDDLFATRYDYAKDSYNLELAYELNGIVKGVAMSNPDWGGLMDMSMMICRELINNGAWRRKAERWPG